MPEFEEIEYDFVIDGKDVRATFFPVEDMDASDFAEGIDPQPGSFALFNMKNDQSVIGDMGLYEFFNTATGEQDLASAGGVFLQDGWYAVLMLPSSTYPAGSDDLADVAEFLLSRYVAWNDGRLGDVNIFSDDAVVSVSMFPWTENGLTESDVRDMLKEADY